MGSRVKMLHRDANENGFVNGFFLGQLWDVVLWLWSARRITSCRQVAQHGTVGGMSRWKTTRTRGRG